MDQTYMKEQPILKLIVSMALPMVISMMVSSLYNIVDSFFIARISEDAMTALSLVYPVQNLINAVMIGFGIGINAVISFYLGAQDKKMADRAATQGMLLGTIHGVGFMILGIAVMRPFLQMFTGNAQIVDYGVRYSRIAFLFATALSWQLVFEKTFQAVGRMVESMTCMMCDYQHYPGSSPDLRTWTISEDGNRRSRTCNRNRTGSRSSIVPDLLYRESASGEIQKEISEG